MAFMPNPPPTSGLVTRTASSSMPSALAKFDLVPQTPCPFTDTWRRSPSYSAKQPRGSIEFTMTRLSPISRLTVLAAASNAAVVAASSPMPQSKALLSGASSCTATSLGVRSKTAGRSTMSSAIISVASRAAARLSATIIAIGSPTKRTLFRAKTGRSGAAPSDPSRFLTIIAPRWMPTPSASRSASVAIR